MRKCLVMIAATSMVLLAACAGTEDSAPTPTSSGAAPHVTGPDVPIDARVDALLAHMTEAEKFGQMTQLEEGSVDPQDTARLHLGSVLHGGGGVGDQSLDTWAAAVREHQEAALRETRLGIPLLYGIDAMHGFGALHGATVFPHQIGLGAANDPELMERIGRATALETTATGIRWNFSPVLAIPDDVRWGRTYEAYSQDPARVSSLATPYIRGLLGPDLTDPTSMLATPKHFIGDGQAEFGTSTRTMEVPFLIDQGVAPADEQRLREDLLPPYRHAFDAGALSVMPSFSSWGANKAHASEYLLTDVLRSDMGFKGFVISDWEACDQIDPDDYNAAIATCVNAGVDMVMVPYDGERFQAALAAGVASGAISEARIDEAVSRILRVKFAMGLFEDPLAAGDGPEHVGSADHRAIAREAVAKSAVLLKNDGALPRMSTATSMAIIGNAADDMGIQAGGWTMSWQGDTGDVIPGTTIADGIADRAGADVTIHRELPVTGNVDVCVIVVGEEPYAEGIGDSPDLALEAAGVIHDAAARCRATVLVLVTGRPVIVTDAIETADAVVAAWLPGTAGEGVADVLFGDVPFTGTLPMAWPGNLSQVPTTDATEDPLYPVGYVLTY